MAGMYPDRPEKGDSLISFPSDYVVFDLETTGLDPYFDRIIEIGAIKYKDRIAIDKYEQLVYPERHLSSFITELTGITDEMLLGKPTIAEVLPSFMEFIGDATLVGFNVNFDINFIYDNLEELGMPLITNNFVCTYRLSRRIVKNLNRYKLKNMCDYYHIDNNGSHRAINDVLMTNQLLINLEKDVIKQYGSIEQFLEEIKRKKRASSIKAKASELTTDGSMFNEDCIFYERNVCITGKLEKMLRRVAQQKILDIGGTPQDDVTKETNYLILGNNDYNPQLRGAKSNKLKKAESMILKGKDIEILSENVFYDEIETAFREITENRG